MREKRVGAGEKRASSEKVSPVSPQPLTNFIRFAFPTVYMPTLPAPGLPYGSPNLPDKIEL